MSVPVDAIPHERPELLGQLQAALQERYAVERELGRGGMGTVFLARELKHGRPVAIKVLHPDLATSLGAKRFVSEIRIAANLNHPHIVTVFESGEAASLLYYVMPYVEGESLRDRLKRDRHLPVEEAVRITLDVAEALAFAHACGVVHRDIKPENILLAVHGHASVADFGVARAISTAADECLTETGLILGSPPYMSPEQADRGTVVDGRADIYSLGCVLHEMLAGAPPFGANGAQATILRHLTEEPAPLRSLRTEVPPALEAAVLKALEKEPGERFAGAKDLAAALIERDGAPTGERRRRRPPRRLMPRNPRALAAVGGVALVALVVFVVISVLRPKAAGPIPIMVLPFDAWGERAATGPRRDAPPDLWLATSLDLLPLVEVIDARATLARAGDWRALPIQNISRRAARQGARYFITGSLLEGERDRRLSVDLYSTREGRRIYNGPALPGESPAQALDRMALKMIRAIAEAEDLDLGSFDAVASATTSLTALTQLLEGQRLFWRGETDGAVRAFRWAIEADSSFGPAYYRLSIAETWSPRFDFPAALAATEAGLRWADRMPPRWAELLAAQRHLVRRSADSTVYQFEKVGGENPRLPDALLGMGEASYHFGGMLGENPTAALRAFLDLVAEDSTFAPIYDHIVDLALHAGNERVANRYLPRIPPDQRPGYEAAVALRFGDRRERARALDSLRNADRRTITLALTLFVQDTLDLATADTLAALLTAPGRNAEDRTRGAHYRLAALTGQGRWADGIRQWERATGGRSFDPWIIHGYLAGHPAEELVAPMFTWARARVAAGEAPRFEPLLRREAKELELRDAFRALVLRAMLHGDSAEVRDLLRRIEAAAHAAAPSDPEPEALRASLLARLALLGGDTTEAILQLERAVARAPWTSSYYIPLTDAAPQRLLLARLLATRGDVRAAERRLRSFGRVWSVGDAVYLPAVARARAELHAPRRGPAPPRP